MAGIDDDVKTDAAAHFAKINATNTFISGRYSKIFALLYREWLNDPKQTFSAVYIAHELGRTDDKATGWLRQAMGRIRADLAAFNQREGPQSFVRFDIPIAEHYQLVVTPTVPSEDRIRVLLRHRAAHSHWLKDLICADSDNILFVGFSPLEILIKINPWFKSGEIKTQEFRLLTWNPESDALVAAMATHIGGEQQDLAERINSGIKKAEQLKIDYPSKVHLRYYKSIPTALGICTGERMSVEPIPFNKSGEDFHECGALSNRPALLLDAHENKPSFRYFRSWFEDLWRANEPVTERSA